MCEEYSSPESLMLIENLDDVELLPFEDSSTADKELLETSELEENPFQISGEIADHIFHEANRVIRNIEAMTSLLNVSTSSSPVHAERHPSAVRSSGLPYVNARHGQMSAAAAKRSSCSSLPSPSPPPKPTAVDDNNDDEDDQETAAAAETSASGRRRFRTFKVCRRDVQMALSAAAETGGDGEPAQSDRRSWQQRGRGLRRSDCPRATAINTTITLEDDDDNESGSGNRLLNATVTLDDSGDGGDGVCRRSCDEAALNATFARSPAAAAAACDLNATFDADRRSPSPLPSDAGQFHNETFDAAAAATTQLVVSPVPVPSIRPQISQMYRPRSSVVTSTPIRSRAPNRPHTQTSDSPHTQTQPPSLSSPCFAPPAATCSRLAAPQAVSRLRAPVSRLLAPSRLRAPASSSAASYRPASHATRPPTSVASATVVNGVSSRGLAAPRVVSRLPSARAVAVSSSFVRPSLKSSLSRDSRHGTHPIGGSLCDLNSQQNGAATAGQGAGKAQNQPRHRSQERSRIGKLSYRGGGSAVGRGGRF